MKNQMKRRTFLQGIPLVAALPWLLREALCGSQEQARGSLAQAMAGAQAKGKPLVVLLGPPVPEKRNNFHPPISDEAEKAGVLLQFGGQDFWLAMALADLALAPRDRLLAFANERGFEGELSSRAWAVILEWGEKGDPERLKLQALTAPMPEISIPFGMQLEPAERLRRVYEYLDEVTAPRSRECVAALIGSSEIITARAARSRAKVRELPEMFRGEIDLRLSRPSEEDSLSVASDGELRWVFDGYGAQILARYPKSERVANWLAAAARDRVWREDPKGGSWVGSSGCGASFVFAEDEANGSVSCGIAHSPLRSRRFLCFYVPSEVPIEDVR